MSLLQVPPLFTENFDYQFFYPDFVNGILTSDLLGKTICCTIIGEGSQHPEGSRRSTSWAGVVGNTRSYDAVRFVLPCSSSSHTSLTSSDSQ
jgi:translation initiation factor eIF-2B subunit epsilon